MIDFFFNGLMSWKHRLCVRNFCSVRMLNAVWWNILKGADEIIYKEERSLLESLFFYSELFRDKECSICQRKTQWKDEDINSLNFTCQMIVSSYLLTSNYCCWWELFYYEILINVPLTSNTSEFQRHRPNLHVLFTLSCVWMKTTV